MCPLFVRISHLAKYVTSRNYIVPTYLFRNLAQGDSSGQRGITLSPIPTLLTVQTMTDDIKSPPPPFF